METLETLPKADPACDESTIAVYDRLMVAVRGFPRVCAMGVESGEIERECTFCDRSRVGCKPSGC